jgi:endonuclease/exonuclease/phosphatase family metal-dependent hydrolase
MTPRSLALCAALLHSAALHAQSIKITTWNLNWFTTNPAPQDRAADAPHRTQADIAALRAYADRLNADIVALEELDGTDSAAALFPTARYTLLAIHQSIAQQVGLAVRRPLTVTQNPDLADLDVEPGDAPHRLRHGLDATITFPGGTTLRLLAIHLKTGCITDELAHSRRPACILLAHQIPPLAAWLAARAADGKPFALLGDFNRDFDHPEALQAALDQAAPLLRVTAGTSDPCWEGGPFIDHIFLGGPARAWLVPSSLRVMTYKAGLKDRLSDHCPVSVILELKK